MPFVPSSVPSDSSFIGMFGIFVLGYDGLRPPTAHALPVKRAVIIQLIDVH